MAPTIVSFAISSEIIRPTTTTDEYLFINHHISIIMIHTKHEARKKKKKKTVSSQGQLVNESTHSPSHIYSLCSTTLSLAQNIATSLSIMYAR